MESEVLVKVEGVSKKFCRDLKRGLWYGVQDIARETLGFAKSHDHLRQREFWALKNVGFEVRRGECLGLLGKNGAGKSTLLKMLNGLIKPDQGRIEIRGRIGALIELGAGFNPILTGRENIYVNGAILGFTKAEIDRKIDSIVEFSEIGTFINTPVQYYSSGMKVRLGFAIAAQVEPDVLLIDEVLAVGDIGFVLKCFNKMDSLLKNTALILVSHNIPQIARMSTNIMLLSNGECVYNSDNVSAGITMYYEFFKNEIGNFVGSESVTIKSIVLASNGEKSGPNRPLTISYGKELTISIELSFQTAVRNPSIWLAFYDKEQRIFAEVRNFSSMLQIDEISGNVILTAYIPSIQFGQGNYSITIGFSEVNHGVRQTLFRYQSAIYFNVDGKHHGWAPIQLTPEWRLLNK